MSDLAAFAAHCREMAAWTDPRDAATGTSAWCREDDERLRRAINLPDHERCDGHIGALTRFTAAPRLCACECHPRDPGPSDADRELWTRLADEISAYLEPHPTLWGDEDGAGMAQNGPETAPGRDGGASCVSADPADDDSAREGTL